MDRQVAPVAPVGLVVALRIALVRHPAPSVGTGICYGRLDVALSPDGISAVPGIARQLVGFSARKIWSSPARRCLELARAISAGTNASKHQDARLLELDFGAWEGQRWDDVPREALDRWAADPLGFAPPGGENGAELIARLRSFRAHLMAERQDCVVVSHGGPLKVLAALLRDSPVNLLANAPAFGRIDIVSC